MLGTHMRMAPVKCAFPRGKFVDRNWNCCTMDGLRDNCDYEDRDDGSAACVGVIRIPESHNRHIQQGYIVMTWYKDRGTTGRAYVMYCDYEPKPLTLKTAGFVVAQKVKQIQSARKAKRKASRGRRK